MNLNTPFFLCVFLPAAYLAQLLLPSRRGRDIALLVCGLVFCAFGSFSAMALMVFSALVVWGLGRLLCTCPHSRGILTLGIVWNLGLLVLFRRFGGKDGAVLGIGVPIGLSYFTFRCISWLVDQYRSPERVPLFGLMQYALFFPELTAGPLSRYAAFSAQLAGRRINAADTASGLRRFLFGLGKKMLLVVPLAKFVDQAFSGLCLTAGLAWLGAAAFMLQIYLDFSGYSDMAIGLARMFGIRSPENFCVPYLAVSLTDFWRRWHISLSSWIRDYLYIPLGGSRKGVLRSAANKWISFALCGLWHGSGMTFLLWGVWHGCFSAVETLLKPSLTRLRSNAPGRLLSRLGTLLVVCLGFVLFRAPDFGSALHYYAAMLGQGGGVLPVDGRLLTAMAVGTLLCFPVEKQVRKMPGFLASAAALAVLVLCLCALAGEQFRPFLYAGF